jgi:hypothetical protein
MIDIAGKFQKARMTCAFGHRLILDSEITRGRRGEPLATARRMECGGIAAARILND